MRARLCDVKNKEIRKPCSCTVTEVVFWSSGSPCPDGKGTEVVFWSSDFLRPSGNVTEVVFWSSDFLRPSCKVTEVVFWSSDFLPPSVRPSCCSWRRVSSAALF